MAGSDVDTQREASLALRGIHTGYLGKLFPALLSHVLLLRVDSQAWHGVRTRHIHRGKHSRNSAYAKWCRAVALCREDYAHTLWHIRHRRPELRADSTQYTDIARSGYGRVCMGGTIIYEETN